MAAVKSHLHLTLRVHVSYLKDIIFEIFKKFIQSTLILLKNYLNHLINYSIQSFSEVSIPFFLSQN